MHFLFWAILAALIPDWAFAFATAPKIIGGTGSNWVQAADVDSSGNIIVGGELTGQISLGNTILKSTGFSDIFIAKLDSSGNSIWAQSFGSALADDVLGIKTDAKGNFFLVGAYQKSISFGGIKLESKGGRDIFAVKMDGNGKVLWAVSIGDDRIEFSNYVNVDANGDVYLGGSTNSDTIKIAGIAYPSRGGAQDALFIKMNGNTGAIVWAKRLNSPSALDADALAIAPLSNGDIVLTGFFNQAMNLGGQTLTSPAYSVFVADYEGASGALKWQKSYPCEGWCIPAGIAADSKNNIYLSGMYQSTLMLDGTLLKSNGEANLYIAKIAPASGSLLWVKNIANKTMNWGNSIAIGDSDNLYLMTSQAGDIDYGGGTEELPNGYDGSATIVKYTSAGAFVWSQANPGNGIITGAGYGGEGYVRPRSDGTLVLNALFNGSIRISNTTYSATSGDYSSAIFFLKQ